MDFKLGEPFTPSSSPPSSPLFEPADSSPMSSPSLSPIIFDSPGLSHPFAASSKSDRRPILYEKKFSVPTSTPPSGFISNASSSRAFKQLLEEDDYMFKGGSVVAPPKNREATIWDDAISNAVDNGRGTIELGSRNLTYIPQSIGDLVGFCVIPERLEQANLAGGRLFSRTKTTPIHTQSQSRSFERTASITESTMAREEIQLYLASNQIRTLPRELFNLTKMTVLSLRNNKLTHLPAEISLLRNLREFNVSNNQLTYLPSEMLNMKLQTLALHPNPFLPEPVIHDLAASPLQVDSLRRRRSMTRVLSRSAFSQEPNTRAASRTTLTYASSPIPPFFELCLRVLLSPYLLVDPNAPTNLVGLYDLPIPGEWGSKPIPPSVQDILNACVPKSVSVPKTRSPNLTPRRITSSLDGVVMGTGVCPNPAHQYKTVFARHMEERFTWENVVAGMRTGAVVPMKWRGCLRGCLAFLDMKTNEMVAAGTPVVQREDSRGADMDIAMNDDEDVDMDESVVQPVSLAPLGFGDIDFEDEA